MDRSRGRRPYEIGPAPWSLCPSTGSVEAHLTYLIRRSEGPEETVFDLSGEMDGEHAARLENLLAIEGNGPILLDLKEVTLVAREAVQFLARVEARGVGIVNCPEYVRSWIAAEKAMGPA